MKKYITLSILILLSATRNYGDNGWWGVPVGVGLGALTVAALSRDRSPETIYIEEEPEQGTEALLQKIRYLQEKISELESELKQK